jgi:hypothetical protein
VDVSRNQVHLPLIAAELPTGWRTFEQTTFVAPSGQLVLATLGRAEDDVDAAALIDEHLARLRDEYGEPVEISRSTGRWRGTAELFRCTTRFSQPAHQRSIAVVVVDGLTLTVTGEWPTDGDDGSLEVETVMAGIRLLSRPAYEPELIDEVADSKNPVARPPVASEVWAQLHEAWSRPNIDVEVGTSGDAWSHDELATVATILGAPAFPTVDADLMAALPEAELHAVLGATMRSFVARGLVEISPTGSAELSDRVRSMMETALFPDVAISIVSGSQDRSSVSYFGVRPDAAVRVETLANGARSCSFVDPHQVVDAIMAMVGRPDNAAESVSDDNPRLTADELGRYWGAMERMWQISSTWRSDSLVTGCVLHAARSSDGRLWIADPDDDLESWTVRLVDFDQLRREVVACLPSGS